MLRDRLVCGINDETTQRLLLAEPNLTYKKALEIATSQESASKNVQTIRGIQGRVGTPISQVPPVLVNNLKPHLNGNLRILVVYATDVEEEDTSLLSAREVPCKDI